MTGPDAIRPVDLPVMPRGQHVTVRMLDVIARNPEPDNPTIEAVALWKRLQVQVFDFYRFRPERP